MELTKVREAVWDECEWNAWCVRTHKLVVIRRGSNPTLNYILYVLVWIHDPILRHVSCWNDLGMLSAYWIVQMLNLLHQANHGVTTAVSNIILLRQS